MSYKTDGPLREFCSRCGEPILDNERADNIAPFHEECLFRSVMGSIAHLKKACSCFVPGSSCGDPDGMTKREAAKVAHEYWLRS